MNDELNASNNMSQLVSITEEPEAISGSGTTETQLGIRNNLVRSSKEILKTHKAFPGFKKLKDKEKDKDKADIDEDTDKKKKSIGSLANVSTNTSTISNTKLQSNKSGNIFSDGAKESVIIAATKQLTKKDKRFSSTALQTTSVDAIDSTYLEKVSPSTQIKRKSSSVDVASNGPIVQMSTFSNGNSSIAEEKNSSSKSNTISTSGNGNTNANGDLIDGSNITTDSIADANERNLIAENSF